jgi:hypothetical protein
LSKSGGYFARIIVFFVYARSVGLFVSTSLAGYSYLTLTRDYSVHVAILFRGGYPFRRAVNGILLDQPMCKASWPFPTLQK